MATVNMREAKTHLSRLVARALAGEEILIARDGTPVARLVAVDPPPRRPPPGLFKADVWLAEDWEAPLPDDIVHKFYAIADEGRSP